MFLSNSSEQRYGHLLSYFQPCGCIEKVPTEMLNNLKKILSVFKKKFCMKNNFYIFKNIFLLIHINNVASLFVHSNSGVLYIMGSLLKM